ncbi:hypothetical protein H310_04455 [Aphanomyces invadans]|uniref:Uncharacterized protein n=1 Tax=Aphanomyces invadans TaxID=157072 RepID=A0A024UCD7_9STRA|nr:hypothetical protein H310_04455 [Aphanomyces invadans]ETW04086.1 hypothetical protein H310_04455 [Aphanomyces invadans]|eukprot:XP_008867042.1 hypothetical protein H310_04455 [Aphanomyces invadans]
MQVDYEKSAGLLEEEDRRHILLHRPRGIVFLRFIDRPQCHRFVLCLGLNFFLDAFCHDFAERDFLPSDDFLFDQVACRGMDGGFDVAVKLERQEVVLRVMVLQDVLDLFNFVRERGVVCWRFHPLVHALD